MSKYDNPIVAVTYQKSNVLSNMPPEIVGANERTDSTTEVISKSSVNPLFNRSG
jgi:hypothetical protein